MQNYIRKEFAHKSFAVSIEGDNIKPLSKPDRDLLWGLKKVDKNRWITGFFDVKEDENAQGWGLDKRIFHPRDIRAGYFSFSEIADNQVSFELSTNSRLKGVIKFENIRCLFFAFNTISDYLRRCGDAEKLDFNTISENLTKTYLAKCQYKEYLLKKINELKINIEYSSRSVPRKDNRFYEKVMIENDDEYFLLKVKKHKAVSKHNQSDSAWSPTHPTRVNPLGEELLNEAKDHLKFDASTIFNKRDHITSMLFGFVTTMYEDRVKEGFKE